MEVKVVVAYHKPSLILDNPVYIPLQVGKALHPDIDLGMRCDNEGDNISDENGYLCELTALYWIWKNVKADAKGLFHYRRISIRTITRWSTCAWPIARWCGASICP